MSAANMKVLIVLTLLFVLSGCAVQHTRVIPTSGVEKISTSQTVKSIEVSKIIYALPDGKVYAKPHAGVGCFAQPPITWKGGASSIADGPVIGKINGVLTSAAIRTNKPSEELFAKEKASDYVLAGKVNDLEVTTCGEGTFTGRKGSATVSIEWQIFSNAESKVIRTISTDGSFQTDSFDAANNGLVFIHKAVEAAAKNLVAHKDFRLLF
jgi:hypothetical protein